MSVISALIPTQAWIHTYISQPFWEGAERLKRAYYGVNRHLLAEPKISLKERICNLAIGLLLVIPLIGTIVWIAMQTFSDPHFLSPPFTHRVTPNPELTMHLKRSKPPSIQTSSAIQSPLTSIKKKRIEAPAQIKRDFLPKKKNYTDEKQGTKVEAAWTFEQTDDLLIAKSKSTTAETEAHYKSGRIQVYNYISTSKTEGELYLKLEGNTLNLRAERVLTSGKTQTLAKSFTLINKPWIQQTTLGLRDFILSKDDTLEFYGVHPEEFTLTDLSAKKGKLVTLDGHGPALHVQIKLFHLVPVVDAWFDPNNGLLIKSVAKTGLFSRITTEAVKS